MSLTAIHLFKENNVNRTTTSNAPRAIAITSWILCAGSWHTPVFGANPAAASGDSQSEVTKYADLVRSAYEQIRKGECAEAAQMLDGTASAMRGWEFEYLKGIAKECPKKGQARVPGLRGPFAGDIVNIAAPDPRRGQVAMPCADHTLRLLDLSDAAGLAAGKPKITTAFSASAQLIIGAFSGDGSLYAVGGEDGHVYLWRPGGSGEPDSFTAGDKPVTEVALNKNATRLITETDRGEVALWSLPDQKQIRVLGQSFMFGRPILFSPDGGLIAMGGMEKIEIYSAETGAAVKEIGPHGHYVMSLAFSSDGKLIASGTRGSFPKSVAVYEMSTGQKIFEFDGHETGITGVAFSKNGTRLVSTSGDGTLRFLHIPSGVELLSLRVGGEFGDPRFSSDERTLLWSGRRGLELIQLP